MKVFIFEDEKWENLTPLSYNRPVFELRCGMHLLLDRILSKLQGMEKSLGVRDYLASLVKMKYNVPVNEDSFLDDDIIFVNGRWLVLSDDSINQEKEEIVISGDDIVYAVLKKETIGKFWNGDFFLFLAEIKKHLPKIEKEAKLIQYPWDLVHYNPEVIKDDFHSSGKKGNEGKFSSQAVIYGPEEKVYVAPDAEIHPLVVLDTNSGPIFIDKKAAIFPNARIEGPCYIGENTQIMPGANIREGNSFGPVCRIGGEVEESIFHSYANKYHDGFIGHSYIGEFVNLGAMTTNSDLKNDYSSVSVYVNVEPTDTGDLKVGSFIGDHTKTSIGTLLNTGTSAGIMCNITAGGILPKFFPSFTWYINGKYMKGFGLEMMLNTAKTVMKRRKRTLSQEEENVMRKVYEMTDELRKKYIKKTRKTQK